MDYKRNVRTSEVIYIVRIYTVLGKRLVHIAVVKKKKKN